MTQWWRDGAMVCEADGTLDDDQHFVADAASDDDAQRLVDWHNATMREVERERDLAIAHDRQPYPTAWAYEQVCRARDNWHERARAAEAALTAALRSRP